VTHRPDAALASAIVWFDAFVTNVDRTVRNTNMLMWHRQLHLIDHGAALYFHHDWDADYLERSRDPFPRIREHVLLPFASALQEAHESMLERLTPRVIRSLVALVPDDLLAGDPAFQTSDEFRDAYERYLLRRLEPPHDFFMEAQRVHAQLV
jgi:hypothetical protein